MDLLYLPLPRCYGSYSAGGAKGLRCLL
jgi:hypothetical protein